MDDANFRSLVSRLDKVEKWLEQMNNVLVSISTTIKLMREERLNRDIHQ